ncbi:sulfur oxidation c-type cytochrome SoxA [Pseudorhodoferax soli]|jgi:sulfur-oxidizing protein SoxA|uniref:L-cysteine S-thiosulfotransferase subunit SoxA n=1 Tax=Pseudorhodoferax soli TaxID=545864 RepID=A0A368Y796_9BURK|nr:sulfur oxidation c-type cytochrome SoxA [Pseudorhodoferax soli]RCW75589.1 sulfur-oxidizing protein SoxA [Pseudorhodoferax soli]
MRAWLVLALVCAPAGAQQARSGLDFMGPATQAMQRDDSQNPAMLWLHEGQALWQKAEGRDQRSCMSCHGDASQSMRGVATRYPAFDTASQGPLNLSQRIAQCRAQHQQAAPWAPESEPALSLETYVAQQSRGLPIAPPDDPRLAPFMARGQAAYARRIGQLDMSCAQCHDGAWDRKLAGNPITQGQATGYPIYRLEWQGMGSLQRRLRNCMTGVRAQAPPFGSAELVELELYLAQRARGLPLETPAVRP